MQQSWVFHVWFILVYQTAALFIRLLMRHSLLSVQFVLHLPAFLKTSYQKHWKKHYKLFFYPFHLVIFLFHLVGLDFNSSNCGTRNHFVLFFCRQLSLAFMCTLKFSSEQIWTLGWAFMQRNTNVQASQGLYRATEPWTVKMSGPINNNAGSSMLDLNVCTSFCIFRWSTWEVYLCHTVSEFFFFHDRSFQSEAVAMGLISLSQSTSVRFKATKPQGSQAAAACSADTAGSCSKSDGIGQVNVHEGVILVEEKHISI